MTKIKSDPTAEKQIAILGWLQLSRSVVSDSLRPMDCSTPGLPVHHQLPELISTKEIVSGNLSLK